jgi:hypothetical protein
LRGFAISKAEHGPTPSNQIFQSATEHALHRLFCTHAVTAAESIFLSQNGVLGLSDPGETISSHILDMSVLF